MRRILASAAMLLLLTLGCMARTASHPYEGGTFKIASIFSDNMVIQRDAFVPIWGWGERGTKVTLTASWTKKKYTSTVTDNGEWLVAIPSPEAGGPYSITISASEPSKKGSTDITIDDVMCGEVWICSGQSNMDIPLRGYGFQYVEGAQDAVMDSPQYADRIRIFKINADTTTILHEDCEAHWAKSSPAAAADVSALGYYFARRITNSLGVPVGIIVNAWGGSMIEAWMPRETIREVVDEQTFKVIDSRRNVKDGYPTEVASCYNSRMFPIREYAARGFLWYQGCGNIDDAAYYKDLMTAMAKRWRSDWSDPEAKMPFMFVTIAPYDYGYSQGTKRPLFVEGQLKALETIPNSYAAISETYGMETCIHPPYKQQLADQFALEALSQVYGLDLGICHGYPKPGAINYESGKVTIKFENALGLGGYETREVRGFEVAGNDRVFHPCTGRIQDDGLTVVLDCSDVPSPVAVRYSFHNYVDSNLRSSFGVPVPPFRTDSWE